MNAKAHSSQRYTVCFFAKILHIKQGRLESILWDGTNICLCACLKGKPVKRLLSNKNLLSVGKPSSGAVECVGKENMVLRATYMRRLAVSPLFVSQSVLYAIVLEWIYVLFAMILMMFNDWNDDDCNDCQWWNDDGDDGLNPREVQSCFSWIFHTFAMTIFGDSFQTK